MPVSFVIISTIVFAGVWSIPVIIIGLRMRRGAIPKKNFLTLTNVLFWMATILFIIAQVEYIFGINQTLANPNFRAQWMAFLWPITFASSLGGFFVEKDRKEHFSAAGKLILSFLLLTTQVISLMS